LLQQRLRDQERLPEQPALSETLKGWSDLLTFQGLFAPKGTPAGITDKIAAEAARTLQSPDIQKKLEASGFAAHAFKAPTRLDPIHMHM
jgi:tripartite-type tricarboxylate transporter receptor subunit TctC